ncbi:MAG: TetR/AcrR family transcriptional regulator [Flavipsychrobacter sp.]|nr:TetR/AcrR family transcriptional regulator [Flavipsychrobacter sp.]
MTKSEKTKQFIIEKTAPVFNKKGYAGTSLADMTEATGLTKGSIYGNFANKDEVALAAFDHNWDMVQKLISEQMELESTVKAKLLVYVHVYEHFLKRPFPQGGCPVLNTATESDSTHPELRKKATNAIIAWKNSIEALVEEGIKNKEFRADLNVEEVSLGIISMLEGGIMIAMVTGKADYRHTILRALEKMILSIV